MSNFESCAISGLEIKDGDAVVFLLVSNEDVEQDEGPFNRWKPVSVPQHGFWDGDSRAIVPRETCPEDTLRGTCSAHASGNDRFQEMIPLTERSLHDRDAQAFVLIHPQVWDFLPELPKVGSDQTVGKAAQEFFQEMREVAKPYVKDEVLDQDGDPSALYTATHVQIADGVNRGWTSPTYNIDSPPMWESMANAEVCMRAESDLFLLYEALCSCRRVLAPAWNSTPEESAKGVGELARFVRRKALAAGFVDA